MSASGYLIVRRQLIMWGLLYAGASGLRTYSFIRSRFQIEPRDTRIGSVGRTTVHLDTTFGAVALMSLVATQIIGTLGAAGFILSVLVLAGLRPSQTAQDIVKFSPVLALPALAMVSTLWSPTPQLTLRAALQVLITITAAILIARRLSSHRMMLCLFVGYLFTCLLILPSVPASLVRGNPLYSSFLGSKNQVGFAAHMLLAVSFALLVDRKQVSIVRLSALASLPLGILILLVSKSGGALTSLLITALTFPPLFLLTRVRPTFRAGFLVIALIGLFLTLVFFPAVEAALTDFRLNVLKKDATLTGRTHLWDVASQISEKNPWLGEGYASFWRRGNLDAEGLWRWGGIASRSGFNFHNAFVEIRVDLGWVGLSLMIAMYVSIAFVGITRLFIKPSTPMAFLLSLLAVLYARSFTEEGLVAPFSVLTVLWISTAVYALTPKLETLQPSGPPKQRETRTSRSTLTV